MANGVSEGLGRTFSMDVAVTKQPFNVLLRDIHKILQTEVNFMVTSHNRNVIIITILQASLRFMRAPTSTQMTTMTAKLVQNWEKSSISMA